MPVSSIVYQTDRRSGSTYAYLSEPTRDPETGRPSQKRTYLGRVDPETGEIVPKAAPGRRNRSRLGEGPAAAEPSAAVAEPSAAAAETASLRDENERLRAEVSRLASRVAELEGAISRLMAGAASIADECGKVLGAGA